jgi:hypothetical protein
MAKIRSTPSQSPTKNPIDKTRPERPGESGEKEHLSSPPEGTPEVEDEFEIQIETPPGTDAVEDGFYDDAEEDITEPPLSDDEVLDALEFITDILAETEGDERYRLDSRERERLVPFVREQLNGKPGLIRAVRSLDFLHGWGIVAYSVVRRGIVYYRAHLEDKWVPPWKKAKPSDQEGPRLVHRL